jgi:hypothetical protein
MKGLRNSRSTTRGVLAAVIIGAALAACAVVAGPIDPVQPTDAGRQAWSERLEEQAHAYREARMWSAWTARLSAQANAQSLRGMSERAIQAWTVRLNGLADNILAEDER